MIDTVHVKYRVDLSKHRLELPWRRHTCERSDGSEKVWYIGDIRPRDAWVRLKYYPFDYSGEQLLCLEISSLPKLVLGNNYQMLWDMDLAVKTVNQILASCSFVPKLDFKLGILYRVDFCYNYLVGDHVSDYINGISQLFYPRRTRANYCNPSGRGRTRNRVNGVSFFSNRDKIQFYDKYKECRHPKSKGILRQEHSIKDTQLLCQTFDKPKPVIQDFSSEIALSILQGDLKQLGLDKGVFTNQDVAFEQLQKKYSPRKAYRLLSVLDFQRNNQGMTKIELAAKFGVTIQTLNSYLRDIKNAGIAPACIRTNSALPPLELKAEMLRDEEYFSKLPSNTLEIYT